MCPRVGNPDPRPFTFAVTISLFLQVYGLTVEHGVTEPWVFLTFTVRTTQFVLGSNPAWAVDISQGGLYLAVYRCSTPPPEGHLPVDLVAKVMAEW